MHAFGPLSDACIQEYWWIIFWESSIGNVTNVLEIIKCDFAPISGLTNTNTVAAAQQSAYGAGKAESSTTVD